MAKEEAEIKELSKKLAQNPDSMVFVQLADAYRRAGDLEKSVEVCLQGLERHPTYTTARAILGRNYLDLERLDEASNEFRQIEVSDPENIMAHRMLGQIFLQKGQFAEAITRQQRVLALDPDDSTAQELLQAALTGAKQAEQGPPKAAVAKPTEPSTASPAPAAKAAADAQSGTLKVAEIYIKKGALDEAAEVLQEILAADPGHSVAQQKLREVNEKRGVTDDGGKKAADEAARKKADEAAKAKALADEAARKKAEEDAKAKAAADEAARKKAEEDAKAKAAADEAARKKAEEDAKAKAAADEAVRKKAEEEAKAKAAEDATRKKAEEEARAAAAAETARKKAEDEAKAKAEAEAETARKKAEEEEAKRKSAKLSSEDILSVMTGSSDELIEDEAAAKPAAKAEAPTPKAVAAAPKLDSAVQGIIDEFVKAQAMEACLLLDAKGLVLDDRHAGSAASLGQTAATIFSNTEKAAQRMQFGGLKQIMIVGEDSRQILFVALKAGVLVALTGKQTNLGLLRVAVNDLVKRA